MNQRGNTPASTAQNPGAAPQRSGSRFIVFALALILVAAVVMSVVQSRRPAPTDGVMWGVDYTAALKQSAADNKPVLLYFGASWCPPCNDMKRDVFSRGDVGDAIRAIAIPVKVDLSSPGKIEEALASQYNVGSIPSYVVVDATGKERDNTMGYLPAAAFEAWLKAAALKAQ